MAERATTAATDELANFRIIEACSTENELRSAARALGQDEIADDVSSFVAEHCGLLGNPDFPICPPAPTPTPAPPTPEPTPVPVAVWDDTAFQQLALDRCDAGRPDRLYSVDARVAPSADAADLDGVYVRLVAFRNLDGDVVREPKLQRGYVYDNEIHYQVDFASEVDLIACVALRAIEREMWYPSHQSGCPCTPYDASDALIWMVDPADGQPVGKAWLRPPADVDGGEHTNMLLGGAEGGPGLRPPEPEDIRADIEAFLGR